MTQILTSPWTVRFFSSLVGAGCGLGLVWLQAGGFPTAAALAGLLLALAVLTGIAKTGTP